ncbi:hypothetical protein L248_0222 [Schleiferilactobacillus shenzhenensis LY-73]|uniref:Uncharacterized protein n=1 Tax=Schleiferilactobacillus shenzhenensis LY-73 TaxID=1231336 RepID=U4TXK3_9LACO|nr:hypothetical protein L248_0222 [Schleiferilactobacillus shenzhenensis LY-73]
MLTSNNYGPGIFFDFCLYIAYGCILYFWQPALLKWRSIL